MRVIDASALVKYFSKERGWEEVAGIILDGVMSVELLVKEVANFLWKKVRLGEVEEDVARELVESIPKIVKIEPQTPLISRAFEISLEHSVTVYDAIYIALAEARRLELVTCDKRQAEVAREMGVKPVII